MTSHFRTFRNASKAAALGLALSLTPVLSVLAEDGNQIDRATITIPSPRSANLLQLRGIGGRGSADILFGGTCHTMPVRLVAGNFEGRQANVHGGEPIVLDIRDPGLVRALIRGTDIVSDGLDVSSDPSDRRASILLLSGLTEGTGFVINPGHTVLSDVLGTPVSEIPCDALERAQASQPEG